MMNQKKNEKRLPGKYGAALAKVADLALHSKFPKVQTIVLIGSGMHSQKEIWTDLDVCFYIQKISESPGLLKAISKMFRCKGGRYLEGPDYISDYHNRRIECTYSYRGTQFEFTFLDGNVRVETTPHLIGKDHFELHIGNLFAHGIVLADRKNSRYQRLKKQYFPYYSEKLRKQRLGVLKKVIEAKIRKLKKYDSLTQGIQANQLLKIALQYYFIQKKVYPYSYEKWIQKQFNMLLEDPKKYKKLEKTFKIKKIKQKSAFFN